jgi:H/ACA ribonucleoprotein complex subunit 3
MSLSYDRNDDYLLVILNEKMKHMLKCRSCGHYTMQETCPHCGGEAISSLPPKYSPHDKYAKYRRQAKEEQEHSD